jgi:hypothetical protein
MVYLGNILKTDKVIDGPITYNALGGAKVAVGPGQEGPAIWDGRTTGNLPNANFPVAGDPAAYLQRWINQIPPSPYPDSQYWPPYTPSQTLLLAAPNSGSALYFDTNAAKGDADTIHDDFFQEHIEIAGVLTTLILNSRHGLENKVLGSRYQSLLKTFLASYSNKDSTPRVLNITHPDFYSSSARPHVARLRE